MIEEEVNMAYAERSGTVKPLRFMLLACGVAVGISTVICGVLTLVQSLVL
jgi:hypothetical protein